MRRLVLLGLGLVELTIAILLFSFARELPSRAEVEDATGRAERVSRNAGAQVRNLRASVARARQRQPELYALAARLQKQAQAVNATLDGRDLTDASLSALGESLGHVAKGLDGLSKMLAPDGARQLAKGLGGTADYLDDKAIPAAENSAAALDKAAAGLKADAARLAALLKERPVELKAARHTADSLKRFEDALAGLQKVVKLQSFDAMRDGLKGMESSLDAAAGQVAKFSGYTIPRVAVKGLRIQVESEHLWPEGKEVADGMRKAAKGCKAAGAEMDGVKKELPKLRTALEDSAKLVRTAREALARGLADEEKLGPVMRRLPLALAQLAEALPDVTAELSRALRETRRLKEIATALRQAQKALDAAAARWPGLSENLARAAKALRGTQAQLDAALNGRDDVEVGLRQTVALTARFADALPRVVEDLDEGLARQEQSLGELGGNLDHIGELVPRAGHKVGRLVSTVRLLLWLVGGLVCLHAGHRLTVAVARAKPA